MIAVIHFSCLIFSRVWMWNVIFLLSGKTGIPAPWCFPFKASFWADLCCCKKSKSNGQGHFFSNIMQTEQPVFSDDKGKGITYTGTRNRVCFRVMLRAQCISFLLVYVTQIHLHTLTASVHHLFPPWFTTYSCIHVSLRQEHSLL